MISKAGIILHVSRRMLKDGCLHDCLLSCNKQRWWGGGLSYSCIKPVPQPKGGRFFLLVADSKPTGTSSLLCPILFVFANGETLHKSQCSLLHILRVWPINLWQSTNLLRIEQDCQYSQKGSRAIFSDLTPLKAPSLYHLDFFLPYFL